MWLENTAGHLPYDYLGTFTQDRLALVVNGNASRLVRTPALTIEEVLNRESFDFSLTLDSGAKVNIAMDLRGSSFEEVRQLQFTKDEKGLNAFVSRQVPWLKGQTTRYTFALVDRDAQVINLKLEQGIDNPIRKLGTAMYLQPPTVDIPELEPPAARTSAVRINYPINVEQLTTYQTPFLPEYKVALPADLKLTSAFGQYYATYEIKGNMIITRRKFILYAGDYSLSEYSAFYFFLKSIKDSRRLSIIEIDPKP